MNAVSGSLRWPAAGMCAAMLATLAGCRGAPRPEAQRSTPSNAAAAAAEPALRRIAPAAGDCGLAAYPVSTPTEEIVAAARRTGARSPNSMMLARVAIDPEGRVTHLRVLRLARPESPGATSLTAQAIDSIKHWRYAPTLAAGKPVAVCADVELIIDLR